MSKAALFWTHVLRAISFLLFIAALGLSFWFFTGFADNDPYPLHLLSAAALCFGVGAAAYIPAFMISKSAHKALKCPPSTRDRRLAVFLVLPWLPLSWYLYGLGGVWAYCAAVMVFYAVITIIWAIITRPQQT